MKQFTLINKERSRIKVCEPFDDISKPSLSINAIMISYGCVYKRSSKPIMKGSRVETIENARKEYKELSKLRLANSIDTNITIMDGSVTH